MIFFLIFRIVHWMLSTHLKWCFCVVFLETFRDMKGNFTLFTLQTCFTSFVLFWAHCTSFIGFLRTLCTGDVYWKVSPILSLQSDRDCGGSELRTFLDAILDTEVIKYFFIFPRQRKILNPRLLRKNENHTSNVLRTHGR
jgi:hypothetical protein